MNPMIGVFGSAEGMDDAANTRAKQLGNELGKHEITLVTGATTGIPYAVTYTAVRSGIAKLWGFSAARNYEEHMDLTGGCDNTIYEKLIYIPDHFPIDDIQVRRKYRNVMSTAICDAGIIVSGRWGTMNEFTNLYDMGRVIGVLTGTGGIANELSKLNKKITKKSKAVIICSSSPTKLVSMVLKTLKERNIQ